MHSPAASYAVLSGGVGGAKLALGLQHTLDPQQLQIIANTGDDFDHLGLTICPDIDTLLYTLAGKADPQRGWGLVNETWQFMDSLAELGGETWFRIGDRDLATHTLRRELLAKGLSLSATTDALRAALGVKVSVWPMSDNPVRTKINTTEGSLDFQDYFVRRQAEPVAQSFDYAGSAAAAASAAALDALRASSLAAVILTPSNPWLSIDPILSLSDIKSTIRSINAPVVAVSPIVGGKALKGPTEKIMRETGIDTSVVSIAEHYREFLDGLVIDRQDAAHQDAIESMGITVTIAQTVMTTLQDKIDLARTVIDFSTRLGAGKS